MVKDDSLKIISLLDPMFRKKDLVDPTPSFSAPIYLVESFLESNAVASKSLQREDGPPPKEVEVPSLRTYLDLAVLDDLRTLSSRIRAFDRVSDKGTFAAAINSPRSMAPSMLASLSRSILTLESFLKTAHPFLSRPANDCDLDSLPRDVIDAVVFVQGHEFDLLRMVFDQHVKTYLSDKLAQYARSKGMTLDDVIAKPHLFRTDHPQFDQSLTPNLAKVLYSFVLVLRADKKAELDRVRESEAAQIKAAYFADWKASVRSGKSFEIRPKYALSLRTSRTGQMICSLNYLRYNSPKQAA